ncbi:hypothetical protein DS884_16065 [Tenacibaculum sp. E3R01]|uniref:hypothetical protein n=1 Tax=unclassified Tenacibaculum TaxID=2635139 RepID=UPI00089D3180|nr:MULTISPECIES: hypothetical protein [unclassified Tenacibaculum]RBW55863.1 hypothetical protein DS884_16065 [Tenacibaculum sp. E3R01]SEE65088.1 hypothetical protein SAMN04487765_3597 [Tenacibaculum sp. MAR_2010_89]
MTTLTLNKKYGITEKKKAELDALSNEVLIAQNEVEQLQAIVNSLTEKSNNLDSLLAVDMQNKNTALANKESLNQIIDNVFDVLINSKITFKGILKSDVKIKEVAQSIEVVINKLIYSAEVVNKLSNLVIRKKAQNPLISDELVTMVTNAGTSANNAVALTLTALNSVVASQTTTIESQGVMALEFLQAIRLFEFITGYVFEHQNEEEINSFINRLYDYKKEIINATSFSDEANLTSLIYLAYDNAVVKYNSTLRANKKASEQLNEAETRLSKATIKLNSLEAGLAAANAAALAS